MKAEFKTEFGGNATIIKIGFLINATSLQTAALALIAWNKENEITETNIESKLRMMLQEDGENGVGYFEEDIRGEFGTDEEFEESKKAANSICRKLFSDFYN